MKMPAGLVRVLLVGIIVVLLSGCAPLAPMSEVPRPAAEGAVAPEEMGLTWRECRATREGFEGQQASECFGGPWFDMDDADRANRGEQTEHGHGLVIGQDAYETREIAEFPPSIHWFALFVNGRFQTLTAGQFQTHSPDIALRNVAGRAAWWFDDGATSTVIYGGHDLRRVYSLDAVYAPYPIQDKLILIGQKENRYFVIYDGQRIGPVFDRIIIAYCCEEAGYSVSAGRGRYKFWGYRSGERYVVEISAKQP